MIQEWEITWLLSDEAKAAVEPYRTNRAEYNQLREAFRTLLTGYFNAHATCGARQGKSINPIGVSPGGAKVLKVRFNMPGHGKSGSLRLEVLADCSERRVVLNRVFRRDQDPEF